MLHLENCPFCGSNRVELVTKHSRGENGSPKYTYYVKCHCCNARSTAVTINKPDECYENTVVYIWNRVCARCDSRK